MTTSAKSLVRCSALCVGLVNPVDEMSVGMYQFTVTVARSRMHQQYIQIYGVLFMSVREMDGLDWCGVSSNAGVVAKRELMVVSSGK